MEIDGHAFCLGIDSMKEIFEDHVGLESMIRSVTYLIKGAIFRSDYVLSNKSGRVSLEICSLGELIDMYHTHCATKRHDKVYALLGMSSDDLSKVDLSPKYEVAWEELMQRLVRFLLSEDISVGTLADKEAAVVKGKGYILGEVSAVHSDIAWNGRQSVDIVFKNISRQSENRGEWGAYWTLQTSAKPIQEGDLICLLKGTSNPAIIRLCNGYFAVIVISASPPEHIQTGGGYIKWPKLLQSVNPFVRDFLLVWDWEHTSEKLQDLGEYDTLLRTLECSKTELEDHFIKATRTWNIALILGDLEEYNEAEKRLREAIEGYKMAFEEKDSYILKCQYGLTPLSWAAGNGYDMVVHQLLEIDGVEPDLQDSQYGQTPLSWAAGGGHEAVVKLL